MWFSEEDAKWFGRIMWAGVISLALVGLSVIGGVLYAAWLLIRYLIWG